MWFGAKKDVDILAARKKAAERAKAGKTGPAGPAHPVAEELRPDETVPAFPPIPETGIVPENAALPVQEEPLVLPAEPVKAGEAPAEPAAETPEAPEAAGPEEAGEPQEPEQEQEQEQEMLAFLLGTEEYVLPVGQVSEVLTPREVTPVPNTPDYILGVCSLRGAVLPVIDLHRRLGLPGTAQSDRSRIIVTSLGQDDRVGLFVDRVRGVVRFLPSAVRPVPETVEQSAEFLLGIVRKDDRLFILLDAEKTAGT